MEWVLMWVALGVNGELLVGSESGFKENGACRDAAVALAELLEPAGAELVGYSCQPSRQLSFKEMFRRW
jgi:hypothetical protein